MQMEKFQLIPITQRGHIFILERSMVVRKNNRVMYVIVEDGYKKLFNIPEINTSMIILGSGTSITSEAIELLAQQGVLIIFSGGHGLTINAGIDYLIYAEPQNEYRPTEYNHKFAEIFLDEKKRLETAKKFFFKRIENIKYFYDKLYENKKDVKYNILAFNPIILDDFLKDYSEKITNIKTNTELLNIEALFTKELYKTFAEFYGITNFKKEDDNSASQNLKHFNYLCYGFSSLALYALGISHSFSMFHGKTRRGGLVFDVADLIKDGISIPFAFYYANKNEKDIIKKYTFIDFLYDHNVLKMILKFLKSL